MPDPSISYDAIVIGGGSGGTSVAGALAAAGRRVAVVERERVGGECAFWGCVPTKVLLRSQAANYESAAVPGSSEARAGGPRFEPAAAWRTDMVSDYDDAEHAEYLAKAGVDLIRGEAVIRGAGRVDVGGRAYAAPVLVIATGSDPQIPPLEGLADGPYWTSREATSAAAVPASLIVLGGGAVGVELAQVYARYGCAVTLVEAGPHIVASEEPHAAQLLRTSLEHDGVTVLAGTKPERVRWSDRGATVVFPDGRSVEAEKLLVAVGRTPRLEGFGLESLGIELEDGELPLDATCRVTDGVYAVGDVTSKGLLTHVAKYQARVAAASILGSVAKARYDAVPRCIYTTPEIAASGMTVEDARAAGVEVTTAHVAFDEIVRPTLHQRDGVDGAFFLVGHKAERRVLGGVLVGPSATESLGILTSAIVARTSYEDLLDVIQPYPTFSEAFYVAVDRLARG